jgi:hypothetical protein
VPESGLTPRPMTLEPECDEAAPLVPHAVLPTPFDAPRYRLAMRCSDRSRLARQHGRLQATSLLRTIGCRRASALDHWSAPRLPVRMSAFERTALAHGFVNPTRKACCNSQK